MTSLTMDEAFVEAQRARFGMDMSPARKLVISMLIRIEDDNEENKWLDEKIKDGWLDAV